MIEQFVSLFTREHIQYVRRRNKFFHVPEEVLEHEKKNSLNPVSLGLLLGEIKNNRFIPSLPLLSWLAKHSERKVFITDKAAWLFLCRRDIPSESIIHGTKEGLVLVQNKRDENLGYGRITKKGITNILDRGDYLRRERNSSSA